MAITLSGGNYGGETVPWIEGQSEMTMPDGSVYRLIEGSGQAVFVGTAG